MQKFLLALLLLMLIPMTTHAKETRSLEELRWEKRVLLIVSRDANKRTYAPKQLKMFVDLEDELAERDLIIHLSYKIQEEYKPFNIAENEFTVLLIGKDGGEKERWDKPVMAEELFALIDAMPMRRREIQAE